MNQVALSHQIKLESADVTVCGLFLYKDYPEGEPSIRAFWQDFSSNKDGVFDDCTGAYRVEIICADGKRIYFSDNSGMMCFYINNNSCSFCSTLSQAEPSREQRRPNFRAATQFLYYGCIYGNETILESVHRSDPEKYYSVLGGVIQEYSKKLSALADVSTSEDALEKQMHRMATGTLPTRKIGCVITGGTDSRAVLSHLLYQNINPALSITGSQDHIDVQIAREIADVIHADLHVISDDVGDQGWIDEAIAAADGMTGVCGAYRLYKKAKYLAEQGIDLEYGGLAGELYKNSFINQDFPFYYGPPKWKRFLRYKVATYDFPMHLCGQAIKEEMAHQSEYLHNWLSSYGESKKKASAYLNVGYRIMQCRSIGLTTMNAQWYIPYNPLLERHVAALAFHKAPYSLEVQAYQRKQVSRFCPQIKKIRTDRGLTCNSNTIAPEYFKSLFFLLSVVATRIFKRKTVAARIDKCFSEGLSSQQYLTAVQRCKDLGILSAEVAADQIPKGIADRLFTIGTMF